MRVGVLGTGMVGEAIATRLVELNHDVMLGSRSATNEKALAWAAHHQPPHACVGTFAEASAFGSFVFNCTKGEVAEDVLRGAAEGLAGKVVIDVTNPLAFGEGGPSLFVGLDDSLAERLQRAVPEARIVKALNTMTADVMVHPELVPGDHITFIAGDDPAAKADATQILEQFGWTPERIVDVGDLTGARATEAYLLLWLKLRVDLGHNRFNIARVVGEAG